MKIKAFKIRGDYERHPQDSVKEHSAAGAHNRYDAGLKKHQQMNGEWECVEWGSWTHTGGKEWLPTQRHLRATTGAIAKIGKTSKYSKKYLRPVGGHFFVMQMNA